MFRFLTEQIQAWAQALAGRDAPSQDDERFRRLVQSVRDYAILMLDPEGRILSWNAGAERIHGYRAEEVAGAHFSCLYPPGEVERGWPGHELEVARARERFEDEGWQLRKDGSRFWASIVVTPLRNGRGELQGFSIIVRDLTERMQTEETMRSVIDHVIDGIITIDALGSIHSFNPAAEKLFGYRASEVKGHNVNMLMPEPYHSEHDGYLANYLRTGQAKIIGIGREVVGRRKDGSTFPMELAVSELHLGARRFFTGIVRDITERKRLEKELRQRIDALAEAEERMRSVVDHVIDGIITIDARGSIESFNPAAEKLFGYRVSEVRGRNVNMLMPEPYHSEHDGYIANYLRTGQAKIIGIGREVVGRRKDGSTFPMELAVSEFHLGARRFFTGIVRDITERKRLEKELRQRIDALAEADRHKNEFLAMLAHELRNPLAPIRNALHVIRMPEAQGPMVQQMQDMMERQLHHLVRLVDDLLDVSRIMRGKIELRKERVNLADIVARSVETAQPIIDAHGHELIVSLPDRPVWLQGDVIRLAQVVSNLLTNAAKYSEQAGRIWLGAEGEGREAVLRVRDSGIGISAELLPHVFDLFVQGDHSLARSQGGLGIGLTLVHSIVELHGGSVSASSGGPGQGTEMVVRLPALAETSGSASAPEAEPAHIGTARRRVLVVEDNVDAAESVATLLRLFGHEVRTVYDGPSALEAARAFRPEVVVLDIGLPGMNGYEVARRLRAEPELQPVRIVALTGYGQSEDRRRAQEAGFDQHMTKPVDPAALRAFIAASMGPPSLS
jgi:PAS domain S-box-containing protein